MRDRSAHAPRAYDIARDRLVLFGGQDGTGELADTWEWDGMDWSLRTSIRLLHPRRANGRRWNMTPGAIAW